MEPGIGTGSIEARAVVLPQPQGTETGGDSSDSLTYQSKFGCALSSFGYVYQDNDSQLEVSLSFAIIFGNRCRIHLRINNYKESNKHRSRWIYLTPDDSVFRCKNFASFSNSATIYDFDIIGELDTAG